MATESTTAFVTTASIDPGTVMGTVHLTVRELERSRAFYERALGLAAAEQDDGSWSFGAAGERALLSLRGDATAPVLDRRATGLFHLAILMPSRRGLAIALERLAQAHWPLDGASDHLVSEALYLSDPDGNGIEIYHDRPREQWPRRESQIEMATLPLDLNDLVGELQQGKRLPALVPAGTTIGHVHLQVAELEQVEAFYHGVLGFDIVVRTYPGALFVSAGGYHHHLGLNTWHSAGGSPSAEGAVGLRSYEIVLPDADALAQVLARVDNAGIPVEPLASGSLLRDPSGIALVLRTA